MEIISVTERTSSIIKKLLEIWEKSVLETHLFLSYSEIKNIKKFVIKALNEVSHLVIIKDELNLPVGFIGIDKRKI